MKGVHGIRLWLKQASPTILSYAGVAGLIATTVTAVKTTPEAIERIKYDSRVNHDDDPYAYSKSEAFKSAWRCYIPTAVLGVSTAACILGSNTLNKRQQATLTSAYMLLNNAYKEYAKKDIDGAVRKEVIKDKPIPTQQTEKVLFYEFNYGDFFEYDLAELLSAEYQFNQKFISRGYACLNDFYEILGLPKSKIGDVLGWSQIDGYPFVDFEHELVELEDGMECYFIYLPDPPMPDYLNSRKMQATLWKGGNRT